ncbi:MAG: hypothetical protein JWO06_3291 [Bacteroidota bacterium]|nr:hypothetical protein [Bacteroidota bacterium]
MLKDKKLIAMLSVSLLVALLIGIYQPREIDWTPTFSAGDKIPNGTYVLYHSLQDLYGSENVSINSQPWYNTLHENDFTNSTAVFIQKEFNPTPLDTKELLAFVAAGNNIFVSSEGIGQYFSDTLGLKTDEHFGRFLGKNGVDSAGKAYTNFTNPKLKTENGYWINKEYTSEYFDVSDTGFTKAMMNYPGDAEVTVLAEDKRNSPLFIRIKFGNGYILLHNHPYPFSNFHMFEASGREYVEKCLSYVPQGKILWDEFYKSGNGGVPTTKLSYILATPALKWAYYTAVAALLLYVIFNIKRRQRIIPLVDTYPNASLEFTQTVGSLYFNRADHRGIALKKISYLMEFIRNRYNIDTTEITVELAQKIAHKSGIKLETVDHLLAQIVGVQQKKWLSKIELIDLNHTIEYFKKNCQ